MELKLSYAAMRILYKITKYRVGMGGFNRPHNVVNGSLRSLRCYVLLFLLGKRSFFIDCTGFGIKSFSLRCKMGYQYQKKYSNIILERKKYLDELIAGRGNGLVKVITGVRRCGSLSCCLISGITGCWNMGWLIITSSKYNLMIFETGGWESLMPCSTI